MGTDIHPIVQFRPDSESPWQRADIPKSDDGYGNMIDGRNYHWFAILGNVRNGTGFAGVRTSAGFPFISDSRGLPDDLGLYIEDDEMAVCPKHREAKLKELLPATHLEIVEGGVEDEAYPEDDEKWECSDCFWFGDHSWSWVTLAELEAYDWRAKTALVGVMPLARPPIPEDETDEQEALRLARASFMGDSYYLEYRKSDGFHEMPASYSGGVSGQHVITIDEPQVQATIDAGLDPTKSYYVRIARAVSIEDAVGHWVHEVVTWLGTLGEPDNVRIVFGFDS